MIPTQIKGESVKAHNAFKIYCEVGGSVGKVAKKLDCSCENIRKWQVKHDWKKRFAALKEAEARARNKAEAVATQAVAVVTEERRAHLAERIVALAEKFVERAHELTDKDERLMVARALGLAAEQIRSETSGASKNYQVSLAVQKEYPTLTFDDEGKRIDTTHMLIRSYQQALEIIDAGESKGETALPCEG